MFPVVDFPAVCSERNKLPMPKKAKYNIGGKLYENQVSCFTEFRKYYLSEYELYDDEYFITLNLVGVDLDRSELQVAVSDRGRISVVTYEFMTDNDGRLYFEYGLMFKRMYLDNFEEFA